MDEFPRKLLKKLPENYEEAAQGFPSSDIKNRILDSEKKIIEIERAREADVTLSSLKEKVKDLNGVISMLWVVRKPRSNS